MEERKLTLKELAELIYNDVSAGKYVTAVMLYDNTTELVRQLLAHDDIGLQSVELEPDFLDGYDREFLVTVDDEKNLWVEKAWSKKHSDYLKLGAEVYYVCAECNFRVLDLNVENVSPIIVELSDDEDKHVDAPADKSSDNQFDEVLKALRGFLGISVDDKTELEVLKFISERFPNDSDWKNGNCYYFARILNDRFKDGAVYYDVIDGHFVFKLHGKYYDHAGRVRYSDDNSFQHYLVPWDDFDEYDSIQKERIIRDCLL